MGWKLAPVFVVLPLLLGAFCSANTILLGDGEPVQHVEFKGRSRWTLIPYLWFDKSVNITCPFTKDFKVYTAASLEQLSAKVQARENVWCGWHNFLGQHSCVARLSPFGPVHIAVLHTSPTRSCSVDLDERLSVGMIVQTLAGALLFLFASQLSASVFFRLGTGSAGVMLLSALILLLLVSRSLPSKRSGMALFAVFGTSFTGMVRYIFGQWIPSFHQLIYNKVVLAYMAISALVGLAVTYYFDREDNVRLHNILKYGLKLAGLLCMGFGTSMPEASVTLCCLLLLTQLVQPALFLWNKGEVSERTLSELVTMSPAVFRRGGRPGKPAVNSRPRTSSRLKPRASVVTPVPSEPSSEEEDTYSDTDSMGVTEQVLREDAEDGEEVSQGAGPSGGLFARAANVPFPGEGGAGGRASARKRGKSTPAYNAPLGEGEGDSPWLKKKIILNTETGRTVQIEGPTWNRLLQEGYQVDRKRGLLTPPPKTRPEGSPASRAKARHTPS